MQIFDRNYRLFGVINLIDLVVVLVIAVGGFAVYRLLSPGSAVTASKAGTDINYTVYCPNMRGVTQQQIRVGDTIYKNTGKAMGTVTAVRVQPVPAEIWDVQKRVMRRTESTILVEVFIDATVKGTAGKTGFAVGDLVLHGGQQVPVMTSTFECDAAVITTMTAVGK